MTLDRFAATSCALLAAFTLTASDCQPSDDDDSSVEPVGCVTVSGGGVFEGIQEAIDSAPEGATISVCAGIYEEALEINKPITLAGEGFDRVLLTGDGAGTVVQIDQAAGLVQITGMAFQIPYEEIGTVRGLRITDSLEVLLHDVYVGFEPSEGVCDHGLVGIEMSRSNVTLSEGTIQCVGYTSPNGGVGILAQTDATLTVLDSEITFLGSFGIRALDAVVSISDSTIGTINRPEGAESFERDGTALFVEQTTEEVVFESTTLSGPGVFGLFIEQGPGATITTSNFVNSLQYGVVLLGGDQAAAGSRTLTVTGSTFTDMMADAIFAWASTTVTGSTISTKTIEPVPMGFPWAGGINLAAPGATVDISGNVLTNLGSRGIVAGGTSADGNIASTNIVGNTIENVVGGNGILVQLTDEATISDNIISTIDHAYNDDPENLGSINTGFGLACFFVDSCVLEGNTVSDAEFGNFVFVSSAFDSTDDTSIGGRSRGFHLQTANGTITNPTITDPQGFGILGLDVTLVGSGGTITGTRRGPLIQDIDGFEDPEEEFLPLLSGGTGMWVTSQGAPTFVSWDGGHFEDNVDGGVATFSSQLQFTNNTLLNNGFYTGEDGPDEICNNGIDDNADELIDCADPQCPSDGPSCGSSPDGPLYVNGNDPEALSAPVISGNTIDGGLGFWGVYLSALPGLTFTDNNVCVGDFSGVYLRESPGTDLSGNQIGGSTNGSLTTCDLLDLNYGIYMTSFDPAEAADYTIEDNYLVAENAQYAIYLQGFGNYDFNGNTITGGTSAGIYAAMSIPTGLTSDNDSDGQAEWLGDCDDTDPDVGGSTAEEIAGDGKDNDCDGVTDDGTSTVDADADGVSIADGDCNDNDPLISPDLDEVVGNFRDDNCDGWADWDADQPNPALAMEDNTITSTGTALWLQGSTADMSTGTNTLEAGGNGVYLNTWTYSVTPGFEPGEVLMGEDTTVTAGGTGIQLAGSGSTATLTGTTITAAGTNGITMSGAGTVTLVGATIEDSGLDGVQATAGTLITSDGTQINGSGNDGVQIDSAASAVLAGLTITGSTGAGLLVSTGIADLDTVTITGSGGSGIALTGAGSVSTTAGTAVVDSAGAGVSATSGTLDLTGAAITNSGTSGVLLAGTAAVSVVDPVIDVVAEYGLSCDGGTVDVNSSTVTLNPCSATVTNATLGNFELFNGCEIDWACTTAPD
ncbi:MAG: hypothetical protein GY898_20565 [Proteobacteria bacterium]|nr:hypothetical protein [Pseudomonadota bacterium]